MAPKGRIIHFLMRYSDNLRRVDTFREHCELAEKYGSVWWGKFGVGIAQDKVDQALGQIESGIPTFLYLTTNRRTHAVAEIVNVLGGGSRTRYQPEPRNRIPTYYRKERCSVWFELRDFREPSLEELSDLFLFNDPIFKPNLRSAKSLIYIARKSEL